MNEGDDFRKILAMNAVRWIECAENNIVQYFFFLSLIIVFPS